MSPPSRFGAGASGHHVKIGGGSGVGTGAGSGAGGRESCKIRLIEISLFVSDLDPFELFKDAKARALVQRSLGTSSNSFHVSSTRRDRLRSCFATYNCIFHSYLLLKCILLSGAKFLLLQHERDQRIISPAFNANFLRRTIKLIGDPLAVLGNDTFYMYFGLVGLAFVRLALVRPFYHIRKHKFDMAYIRFLLAPQLEQQRLDARIRQSLTALEDSIRGYARKRVALARAQAHKIPDHVNHHSCDYASKRLLGVGVVAEPKIFRGALVALERLCAALKDQAQAISLKPDEIASLRPSVFQRKWLSSIRCYTRIATIVFISFCVIASIAHDIAIVYLSIKASESCEHTDTTTTATQATKSQIQDDNLGSGGMLLRCLSFTWRDFLFGLEIAFCMSCCTLFEAAHSILFAVNIVNQIKLVNDTRSNLDRCMQQLTQQYIHQHSGRRLSAGAESVVTGAVEHGGNKWLLKQLASLRVVECELVSGFQALSDQVVQYLFHIVMVTMTLRVTSSSALTNLMLVFVWIWQNVLALSCCTINSRLAELKRRHWSVLALITQIQLFGSIKLNEMIDGDEGRRSRQVFASETTPAGATSTTVSKITQTTFDSLHRGRDSFRGPSLDCNISAIDVLKDIWHKFALSTCGDVEQHCVRPLGVPLTYRRVIQINFMAVFIYSLTLNSTGSYGGFI